MAIPLKDAHKRAVHFFDTQCTSYVKPYAFSSKSIRSVKKTNIPKYQKDTGLDFQQEPKNIWTLEKETDN